jgi:copper(I)-binding protein
MPVAPRVTRTLGLLATLALALGACTSGSGGGGISVTGAWVRVPMVPAGPAGAFLVITNGGGAADALVGASSPAAGAVEVHETTMGADGSMGMRPVARLEIPAGGSVALQSGSYHIMLIGLTKPLAAGETVELTLLFEKAGAITVRAEVRAA